MCQSNKCWLSIIYSYCILLHCCILCSVAMLWSKAMPFYRWIQPGNVSVTSWKKSKGQAKFEILDLFIDGERPFGSHAAVDRAANTLTCQGYVFGFDNMWILMLWADVYVWFCPIPNRIYEGGNLVSFPDMDQPNCSTTTG